MHGGDTQQKGTVNNCAGTYNIRGSFSFKTGTTYFVAFTACDDEVDFGGFHSQIVKSRNFHSHTCQRTQSLVSTKSAKCYHHWNCCSFFTICLHSLVVLSDTSTSNIVLSTTVSAQSNWRVRTAIDSLHVAKLTPICFRWYVGGRFFLLPKT